ncbi:MAG: enoyl-CoA hydratase [Bradyrhizobium sp.]|nr:enoyl-CoA hydratase [Bradyrhizobium sp.]
MQAKDSGHILYERNGPIARITVDRPKKLNAITQQMYGELRRAFVAADIDPQVEVVVLAAAGRAFCAGGDLGEVNVMHDDPERRLDLATAADNSTATFKQMETTDKPIVALVNGLAHAAGMLLAMQSDIVIASERASFRLPEALRGISDVYAAAHLPAYIGVARTKYMLMTCEEISATEAERWGFVAKVVPHERLEAEGQRTVDLILATGSEARVWNKMLVTRFMPPFDNRGLKATLHSTQTKSGTESFNR